MRIWRQDDRLAIEVEAEESAMLAMLLDGLEALLSGEADEIDPVTGVDPALARLYPDGYADDDQAAAEFRELVGADLASERTGRLQACRAELPIGGGTMTLDEEAGDRWIRVLNDVRLVLGVRLEVSEEVELDPDQPSSTLYYWLNEVQEILVHHLMT